MAEERMLNDEILLGLIKANGGGGGGGTSDYEDLSNKPQIGGVELVGNKTAAQLGLVAAVDGKGLSTNDYTDADKAIVGGVTAALADKVDKVDGKGLSSNDFTDAYKSAIGDNTTAISGIKNGASINSFGGVETALADKADKSALKNEFIGTTAEWNALTTAQKKEYDTYQITNDYTEGSGGLPDYSTTEQKTGQKWIDGSDIYVCVFDQGSDMTIGSSSYSDTNIAASGIAKIIEARAMQSNGTYKLINASCDATYVKITSPFSSDTVRYITLFYTKTA